MSRTHFYNMINSMLLFAALIIIGLEDCCAFEEMPDIVKGKYKQHCHVLHESS